MLQTDLIALIVTVAIVSCILIGVFIALCKTCEYGYQHQPILVNEDKCWDDVVSSEDEQ